MFYYLRNVNQMTRITAGAIVSRKLLSFPIQTIDLKRTVWGVNPLNIEKP